MTELAEPSVAMWFLEPSSKREHPHAPPCHVGPHRAQWGTVEHTWAQWDTAGHTGAQ